MANTPDLSSLVESFTSDLSKLIHRATLEELHSKLQDLLGGGGSSMPSAKRAPGRPRKAKTATATAAAPQKKKGGKRTAADLGEMSDALLAHVKANPGARAEQIAAALGTDVGTMRLPMQKLIAEKKVRTEGQRRGTMYFAGAGKAKRAAPKKKAKPARKAKAAKRKKPAAKLVPRPEPAVVETKTAEPELVGAT